MKYLGLIAVLCVALVLVACGEAETAKPTVSSAEPGKAETRKLTKPKIQPPSGPPPTRLIIKDLVEGSGPEAKPGDAVTVHYLGVDENGKERWSTWRNEETSLTFKLGPSKSFQGWNKGLIGMKAGDRRELIIPASLSDGSGPLFYVVDLLEIK